MRIRKVIWLVVAVLAWAGVFWLAQAQGPLMLDWLRALRPLPEATVTVLLDDAELPTPTAVVLPRVEPAAPRDAPTSDQPTPTPEPPEAETPEHIASPTPRGTPRIEATATSPTASAPSRPAAPAVAAPARVAARTPASARIRGIGYQKQSFNNCGPTTLSMQLSALGWRENQTAVALTLRPDKDDRNVSPHEMADYARAKGFRARVIQGGDVTLLRGLIAAGLPVIVETWHIAKPDDEMGHYRLAVGYAGETFSFYDSLEGPDVQFEAAEMDALWKVFNRAMVVVWKPDQEPTVRALLADRWDEAAMWRRAQATAQAEVKANAGDKFAWFNVGTNALALKDPAGAAKAFDRARALGLPWRMMWYQFGPYQAYYAQKRYNDVVALANQTLTRVTNLEESYFWRGQAWAALGNADAARTDLAMAVQLNRNFEAAKRALDAGSAGSGG